MSRYLVSICLLAFASVASGADWRPLSPAELSLKQPQSDPNADAEALFRDVRLLNEAATFGYPHNVITEYVRLKIFTARGKDKYGNVQIPYWGKSIISGVEGRTIRPDGVTVDLKRDAIFDKVIVNKQGRKIRVISFAMPDVEPGAIVEYRYTKNVGEFISRYVPLEVQSEFPVDDLTFHVKPVSGQWVQWPAMRMLPFGCHVDAMQPEQAGFTLIKLHGVPAFHEEPYMPPEFGVKQWILIYYEENDHTGGDKYWASLGKHLYSEYSSKIKVNGDAKNIANEEVAGASTDEEKLARLVNYCRKDLRNLSGVEMTTEERDKAKANNTTADTLRRKEGTPEDLNLAFAALAIAAGYQARVARISDRATFLFNPAYQSAYFLDSMEVAVKLGDAWKFYNVADHDLAPGELPWQEQGVYALILDAKDPAFVKTPLLPSAKSQVAHIANLKLDEAGNLEGDVREYFLGNESSEWRQRFGPANDAEREAALRDQFAHRFSDYELSKVKFTVPADLSKGISVVYHIKISNYAQRTGKRMFVTPAFLEAGYEARFTQETRQQPIYFRFPWTEVENMEIQLPDGFQLDHGDAPGGVAFAPIGKYSVAMSVTKTNTLIYHRELTFGTDSILLFDAKAYPAMKQIFNKIHDSDNHMLTLKEESQKTPAAGQ